MAPAAKWYEIENLQDSNCTLTTGLNALYRTSSPQTLTVPESMGRGFWELNSINPMMELVICDISLKQDMFMISTEQDAWMKFCFCLGEGLQWTGRGKAEDYGIAPGEVTAFGKVQASNVCHFRPDMRFHTITLKLDVAKVSTALHISYLEKLVEQISSGDKLFYNRRTTPVMNGILHEITHCTYQGEIKRIYLEGKILELIAVYLNEAFLEKEAVLTAPSLSRTDIASLCQAKQIVDGNLVTPPSLCELSRLVCLNEFKLKKGFKLLFGMPVHTYIIDQRLERARCLLEEGKVNITSAASMVGFNNPAHFAEKFRKKYGVNPSVFLKQSRRIQ